MTGLGEDARPLGKNQPLWSRSSRSPSSRPSIPRERSRKVKQIGDPRRRRGRTGPSKDGDLALYDGDPHEYTSHCIGVIIDGEVVSEEAR